MAKDGSLKGGARVGSGKKKKALAEKILEGNTRGRLTVLQPTQNTSKKSSPPAKKYMDAPQFNGEKLQAREIYRETYKWIEKFNCQDLIDPQLVRNYAMAEARWIQAERIISEQGITVEGRGGEEVISPYVKISNDYHKRAVNLRFQIYQVIKENSSIDYRGESGSDDPLENLLQFKINR